VAWLRHTKYPAADAISAMSVATKAARDHVRRAGVGSTWLMGGTTAGDEVDGGVID
jgi:hypothetical protein